MEKTTSPRKTRSKRRACPKCGSERTAEVLYGLLPFDFAQDPRNDFIAGGCCVRPDQPEWGCRDCGAGWRGGADPRVWDPDGR